MSEVLVNIHKHFAHRCFDIRRDEILLELIDNGVVAAIEGSIEFAGNQKMKFLCDKYAHVFMVAGCHPNCVEEINTRMKWFGKEGCCICTRIFSLMMNLSR